jgi:inhibitor of Bruton tyrosine kinase
MAPSLGPLPDVLYTRLGPGQHTQYSLKPLSQLTSTVVSVALGQDHSLALTKAGEVLSWGLNRFSQLGYVIETPTGKNEEPIQPTPKKIFGPLKKEVVIGVAASKNASACWTAGEVFTWGTNTGHLGKPHCKGAREA